VLALLLVAVASAARGLAPVTSMLLMASAIMGLGIAVMQPALPALLPRWLEARHLALGSAFYMNGMLMGEFIGAGLTLPLIMPLAGDSWRLALMLWSLPALVIVLLLLLPRRNLDPPLQRPNWIPDWRDPLMWKMGLLLGGTASLFFGTNAYMASVLEMRGELDRLTPVLFWFNLAQAVASLAMLKLASRWVGRRRPVVISCAGGVLAMAAFVLFSGWTGVVFAVIMSFLAAVLLILLVALAPQIAPPGQAGRLAAGTFTIGYTLSFVIPLSGGMVADISGNPLHALLVIGLFAAASLPFALTLKLPD
ncbi:MAG: MFS transporter, partial [Halomonadaceae bacterium]